MLEKSIHHIKEAKRLLINRAYRGDELTCIKELLPAASLSPQKTEAIQAQATELIKTLRLERKKSTGLDSFLAEYALSSDEGIALMCLAEALLRVPDKATIDSLIKDKLTMANWEVHRGQSDSFFVNATTWALMLTGKVLKPETADSMLSKGLFKIMQRSGEGLVRKAVDKAMRIMSKQFVMGQTIAEALNRARKKEELGFRYSYDMLGEAALTHEDALRYFNAYEQAIKGIGSSVKKETTVYQRPGISIKLSALHPRYQEAKHQRVMDELAPRLLALAELAKHYNIGLTIDAEESERLDLSLDLIERVFSSPSLGTWEGFGLAVQSYQKRAFYLLDWLAELARTNKRRLMVRLIKGAYWDTEIKKAQMQGLAQYPVFTRKVFTDLSFQACVQKILGLTDVLYPQFATHNAYSVAMVLNLAGSYRDFEFQCLHGMGNELYAQIVPAECQGIPCRIYAPVGTHEDLLPYLVRRLLENGANSSFVNRIVDEKAPISDLVVDPVEKASTYLDKINQNIPLPEALFLPERQNSQGFDFTDREAVANLQEFYAKNSFCHWEAKPLLANKEGGVLGKSVVSPQNINKAIGHVVEATTSDVAWALTQGEKGFYSWSRVSVDDRALCLERYACLLEKNRAEILALLCFEAGKTWNDALGEVREAIDFCRYYAFKARELMAKPLNLRGYTGELNELSLHPRGLALCISPWNFPLAIFSGQIVAALVTGNSVIAKPAEQTPLIAHFAVKLMHEAGIPPEAIQLLPGQGSSIGAALVEDKRIKAVLFTGSTQTANSISLSLASRGGELIPLIAETGGQNVMLVDSSALLEQVVVDVLTSAFGSAGQRCSALRVLYLQEEIYPRFIRLLKGAMAELEIGDPVWLSTDIGPVIDEAALSMLKSHVEKMRQKYELIYQSSLPEVCGKGYFMPPTAIAIDSIKSLEREVFGPILHVIAYNQKNIDKILKEINETGYGLTLGIHSRINQRIEYIASRLHVGNCYVNRNMIGAVVGLQPFGGQGLSGTGPKAGGPYYLQRLCHEKTFTVDTTAAGGNASLMSLPEG